MKWETSISKVMKEGAVIRGKELKGLVGKVTFTDMIFLTMTGRLPKEGERDVLDALFVSCVDHGIQVPSVTSARIVQSAGNPINASIAAGVLSIGDNHGGAVEQAAKFFEECSSQGAKAAVQGKLDKKERLGGFGHKHYERDPRVEPLFMLAEEKGVAGKHVEFARKADEVLCELKGRPLHLNIDGAMAAILCDLGVPWQAARAFFIIPRTAGIAAHVVEERMSGKVYRRVADEDVTYTGA